MSNRASFHRDHRGDGGFMEALMAMMVVTVAVTLMAVSFAFASHDLGQQKGRTYLQESGDALMLAFNEDVSIWHERSMIWTSMQVRSGAPYSIPDGCSGYHLQIADLGTSISIVIENTTSMLQGDSVLVMHHPCNVLRADGSIAPALITLEVW